MIGKNKEYKGIKLVVFLAWIFFLVSNGYCTLKEDAIGYTIDISTNAMVRNHATLVVANNNNKIKDNFDELSASSRYNAEKVDEKKTKKKGRIVGAITGVIIGGGIGYLLYDIVTVLSGLGGTQDSSSPFIVIIPTIIGGLLGYDIGNHFDKKPEKGEK